MCEKYRVNQFYTAPTAIRALKRFGNEFVTKYDLSSLRVLGTVGEPINPEAWVWYNEVCVLHCTLRPFVSCKPRLWGEVFFARKCGVSVAFAVYVFVGRLCRVG